MKKGHECLLKNLTPARASRRFQGPELKRVGRGCLSGENTDIFIPCSYLIASLRTSRMLLPNAYEKVADWPLPGYSQM